MFFVLAIWYPTLVVCTESNPYLDLPLIELSEVRVTTAAKMKQEFLDAPGVISVITAEEIRAFGANNLIQIVERFPGVTPLTGYVFQDNALAIRGDLPNQNDTHLLILINGRPFRTGFSGGFNGIVFRSFPVEIIDRLELVRGPGSVLYGSNAYSGVLNIITKTNPKNRGELSTTLGSFSTAYGHASVANTSTNGHYFFTVNRHHAQGWKGEFVDELGVTDAIHYGEDIDSFALSASYKGLDIDAFVSNTSSDHAGPAPRWPDGLIDRNSRFIGIGYQYFPHPLWQLHTNLSYTHSEQNYFFADPDITPAPVPRFDGQAEEINAEIYTVATPSKKSKFIIGGASTSLKGEITGRVQLPAYDFHRWNVFFQTEYQAYDSLKLFAGGQQYKTEATESDFIPRLGLIYQFRPHWAVKLLYSEAFRSPYPVETNVNAAPILTGNRALTEELVETSDLQLVFKDRTLQASIGYFHSVQKDLIVRTAPQGGSPGTFVNRDERTIQGIELEAKYQPNVRLSMNGSVSYQVNENNTGQKDVTLAPDFLIKAGLAYHVTTRVQVGVTNNFIGAYEDVSKLNLNRNRVNPSAGSYNLLTANIVWKASKKSVQSGRPATTFSIMGTNLLNEKIYVPEYTRSSINTIPARAERGVYVTATIAW